MSQNNSPFPFFARIANTFIYNCMPLHNLKWVCFLCLHFVVVFCLLNVVVSFYIFLFPFLSFFLSFLIPFSLPIVLCKQPFCLILLSFYPLHAAYRSLSPQNVMTRKSWDRLPVVNKRDIYSWSPCKGKEFHSIYFSSPRFLCRLTALIILL